MLVELRIQHLAVFATASLSPSPRLTVLSGETGAGKSLVVGAVLLLLGERGGGDRVRAGTERATVEGVFEVRDPDGWREWLDARGITHELPHDPTLVLKREVTAAGRSRAWINGGPVTTALLGDVGRRLVTVLGQHESQALADADTQRDALDAYAGAIAIAQEVRAAHAAWVAARAAAASLEARQREAAQRADYLRFVVREIDDAQLREGEPERLDDELQRLSHAEELQSLARSISARLDGDESDGVLSELAAIRRQLHALARIDASQDALEELLDQAEVALGELGRAVESYGERIELDPSRLRAVEQRRATVQGILRKHGPTVGEALATAEEGRRALALVDDGAAAQRAAQQAVDEAMSRWRTASALLSTARRAAAAALASEVTAVLPSLGMPDGTLQVMLHPVEAPSAEGAEHVEWRVTTNAGDPPRPLGRIASGGELARVMLAVSTALARVQAVPTVIFDEIDAGIGGAVAVQVGRAMQQVAAHHQVLAVTHLAQIAACADAHGAVWKDAADGRTTAGVALVEGEARIRELARMLGGDAEREVAQEHARALLAQAQRPSAPTTSETSTPTGGKRRGGALSGAGSPGTSAPRTDRSRKR